MGLSQSAPSCNLVFDKCPGDFTVGTLTVPQNVIWLDPVIPVCTENVPVVTGAQAAPPSIMFIIDNSGSMSTDKESDRNKMSDPDEQRFTVTKQLLDTIAATSPNAEVGLVIFTRRLQFDNRDNPYYKSAFPGDPSQHDAFIPLTPLNKPLGGRAAVDSLKALLDYTGNGNLRNATKQLASRFNSGVADTNTRDGTDITLGFEAAKLGMLDSKAAKGDQYFIFLSDGLPSGTDDSRASTINDFIKGTATPTTFTIFFVPGSDANPQPPEKIVTMTNNIKTNNFSANNKKSAYWAVNQGSQLLTLIQNNVLNPIFATTPAKAASAVMTIGGVPMNNTAVDAKNFTFAKRVPLNATQTTVSLEYTYTYTDSGKTKTKTFPPYIINLNRTGNAPLAAGLSTNCSESADITLVSNNLPVTKVTADNTVLDVHLTLTGGQTCTGCKVQVAPDKSKDKETVGLNPVGSVQVGTFKRETSNLPVANDGTLQNLPSDSIVITWTNPENALDIVRKAFPYSDIATALQVIQHNDVAKADELISTVPGQHFILVAPNNLVATPGDPVKNWSLMSNLSAKDSAAFVGIELEASRAFRVTISVYSNIGQFVNKIDFSITQAEFEHLYKGIKSNTKKLAVLWDNRAQDGSQAGTGAYILKTEVTLLRIPGIADDQVVRSDYRIVGVLRKH